MTGSLATEIPWRDLVAEIVTGWPELKNLPQDLVLAVMMQESVGDPWATRFEPAFYERYVLPIPLPDLTKPDGVSVATERILRSTSFGLMQVMGQVARELGFQGRFLTALCEPQVGLLWGCRQMMRMRTRYPNEDEAIAAYNAGSPRRGPDGLLVNQAYVDGVRTWQRHVRGAPA